MKKVIKYAIGRIPINEQQYFDIKNFFAKKRVVDLNTKEIKEYMRLCGFEPSSIYDIKKNGYISLKLYKKLRECGAME